MATTNTYEYDDPSRVPMTAADHATGTLHDEPTQSHALAVADHDDYGAAGEYHDEPEIRDLGWHEEPGHVARPLVHGLSNEELWMYVRRFNKVSSSLAQITERVPTAQWVQIASLPCQGDSTCTSRRTRSQRVQG